MADDPDTVAELVSGGYEVRKSSVRRSAGSGVEVRVRAIRRRNWSTEDKLRIVREMLAAAMSGLVPVEVMPETPRVEAAVSAPATTTGTPGVIEVAFPAGATV